MFSDYFFESLSHEEMEYAEKDYHEHFYKNTNGKKYITDNTTDNA